MVQCPHCKREAMTIWRKSGLGPGRAVRCQSCGKVVTPHAAAIFAAFPAFLGGFVLLRSDSLPVGIAAMVAGILAMAVIHTFLIPLVRGEG